MRQKNLGEGQIADGPRKSYKQKTSSSVFNNVDLFLPIKCKFQKPPIPCDVVLNLLFWSLLTEKIVTFSHRAIT